MFSLKASASKQEVYELVRCMRKCLETDCFGVSLTDGACLLHGNETASALAELVSKHPLTGEAYPYTMTL